MTFQEMKRTMQYYSVTFLLAPVLLTLMIKINDSITSLDYKKCLILIVL